MQDLYVRTKHTYSKAWSNLDPHALLAQYHVLNRRIYFSSEGYRTTIRVKVKPHPEREIPYSEKRVQDALNDAYSYSCKCEHDCCGHFQKVVYNICPARKKSGALVKSCYVLDVRVIPNI